MRIVVDTNIAFNAILNSDSKIARVLLQPKSKLQFYSTNQLLSEIDDHAEKILKLSKYSDNQFFRIKSLVTNRIRFINIKLISTESYIFAESLTRDIDIDDLEFVALTEHLDGLLWSGDQELQQGLLRKGWKRFITTNELVERVFKH